MNAQRAVDLWDVRQALKAPIDQLTPLRIA